MNFQDKIARGVKGHEVGEICRKQSTQTLSTSENVV